MHLFSNYIEPFTYWVYANPHWALLVTFLVSFSESLAIIGSIVPGSVTMTAIGILAGSGVMRIDLTLLAATLGAIAGDSASYTLGYVFRARLVTIWPFSRYPNWLNYGKEYFARHGGKSVLLGRFVGPLRAMIPVIAGMMHMKRSLFLLANVISAILWSLLYVLPGILIGAASSELSAENASRLFLAILISLAAIWFLSMGLKWLLKHLHALLQVRLHDGWSALSHSAAVGRLIKRLTPVQEMNHSASAGLVILFLLSLLCGLAMTLLVVQGTWVANLNTSVYLFLQSLRTASFDDFFIVITLFIQSPSLIALALSIVLYACYQRDWRTLWYWLSLCAVTGLLISIMSSISPIPRPEFLSQHIDKLHFPARRLTYATVLYGFLIFYISTRYRTAVTLTLRILLLILLLLAGIAVIYLGDNWLTGVLGAYFIGFSICLGHWLFYRCVAQSSGCSQIPIVFSCITVMLVVSLSYPIMFDELDAAHQRFYKQYVMTNSAWWNQKRPILPLYTTNRIGHTMGLFNVQYSGSITTLRTALQHAGWKIQTNSFLFTLLQRANGELFNKELPLMAQLYENRKPILVMTHQAKDSDKLLVIRFWRSNYHLQGHLDPLWLGSLQAISPEDKRYPRSKPIATHYLERALSGFNFRTLWLQQALLKPLHLPADPVMILIREKE